MKKNNKTILKDALLGGIFALVGNMIIYFIFTRILGVQFLFPASGGDGFVTLPLWDIPLSSFVPAVVGGLVFLLISKLSSKPERIFLFTAAIILLLSFLPLLIDVSVGIKIGFALMHIYAAGIITWFILKKEKFSWLV